MDSRIQIEITCHLCRRLANDPRLLDCLHSFCRTCIDTKLKGLLPSSSQANGVVCPVCTHVTSISTNGGNKTSEFLAGNLKKNIVAERLLLNIRQSQIKDVNDKFAIFDNGVHEDSLGLPSSNGNSNKVVDNSSSGSEIISGNNRAVMLDFERCALHDGELKKYFCKACRIAVCASCVIFEHGKNAHEWTTLSEAIERLKEELSEVLFEAESRIGTVEDGISGLEQKIEKVPCRMKAFRDEIEGECDAAIERFTECIQSKRLQLLERVKELERSGVEDIERSRKEGQVIHARLSRVAEYGRNVMMQGSPRDILEWNRSLTHSLEDIRIRDWSEASLLSGEAALDPELRYCKGNMFGVRARSGACPLGELMRPEGWKLASAIKIDRPLGDLVTAIAALRDGSAVIGYQMSGVCFVDPAGNQRSICTNAGRIVDVADIGRDKLAVLNTSSVVNIVQFKGQILELELSNDRNQYLRCLAVTSEGGLVAGIIKQKKICIFRPDGALENTIRTNQRVHRLAATSSHIAMVHDPVSVSIIDMNGKTQCTITGNDWAYASVCSSDAGDFFILSARKRAPKLLNISRYSPDGRVKDTVVEDYQIETLGWLNPRISSAGGRVTICAEDEIITFEREMLVL